MTPETALNPADIQAAIDRAETARPDVVRQDVQILGESILGERAAHRQQRPKEKSTGGRPAMHISAIFVHRLAAIHCTQEEIAMVLDINRSTLTDRFKSDPDLHEAYERGVRISDASFKRRFMLGGPAERIFYAKAKLGWRDTVTLDVHRVEKFLAGRTDEELDEMDG